MTFLNPFALFALAAASLPILFHFFAQRRSRRVEFSTLRFLEKLEKTSMRTVRLKQWLLLLIRTLLIIACVLAFARPALKGYLGNFFGSSHANSTLVFLIDNSASMSRTNERGEFLKQSRDAATEIAHLMEEGDEASVIPIASIESGKQYAPIHSRNDVIKAIDDIRLADRPTAFHDALAVASSILSNSQNVNREVYLFSDGQKRNLTDKRLTSRDSSTIRLFDAQSKIFHMEIQSGVNTTQANLTIDSFKTANAVYEPGRPIEFYAFVRNTGAAPLVNQLVSLFYNDERVAQQSIGSVAPGTTERVTLAAPVRSAGVTAVRVELENDALPFDNKRYHVLNLPGSRRIAVFTSSRADSRFLELALSQTLGNSETTPFSVDVRRLEEISNLDALRDRYDAAFILMGAALPEGSETAVAEFVKRGRGLALFLLPSLDQRAYNGFARILGVPSVTQQVGSTAGSERYASFAEFDFGHPFFTGMFEGTLDSRVARGIESPKIFTYHELARSGVPLIRASSGSYLLSESRVGKGSVLVYALPPTLEGTDFPKKPIFLPLMRRTAAFASAVRDQSDETASPRFLTTEAFDVELPYASAELAGGTVLVRAPDGRSERKQIVSTSGTAPRFRVDNATASGNYLIFKDAEAKQLIGAFAVNIASDESDLTPASDKELDEYLAGVTSAPTSLVKLDRGSKEITKRVTEARYGVELWQSFLYAAIALALLEMLIAREARKTGQT